MKLRPKSVLLVGAWLPHLMELSLLFFTWLRLLPQALWLFAGFF